MASDEDYIEWQRLNAKDDHLAFMRYCWLKGSADPFIEGFHTREICRAIDEAMIDFANGISSHLLISVHPRAGKALALNTPVPTPFGYSTIFDLKIGDKVFDEAGEQCIVVAKSEIFKNRKCYSVETADGEKIISDANHEWVTRQCRHYKKHLPHTTEWLFNSRSQRRPMITTQGPIKTSWKELLIPPYVLGAWLGDGDNSRNAITCHINDLEIIENIKKCGYSAREWKSSNENTKHFQIGGSDLSQKFREDSMIIKLRKLNLLKNKHIPIEYLRSSNEQRMELLQGLIDTDGYVSPKGFVEFCNTNKTLAYDVYELVNSLGVKCSISVEDAKLYGKIISKKYRVTFYMKDCSKLARKRILTRNGDKNPGRYIIIKEHESVDTMCIQVSSKSGMFLCGKSFLPTHNSDIVSRYCAPHFVGEFPDREVMQVTYQSKLATSFSTYGRNILKSTRYRELYPNVSLSVDTNQKNNWVIADAKGQNTGGKVYAAGLQSGLTGNGFHLGILDDYFSGRAEAESKTQRDNAWSAFTDDFMTRAAPVHIVIVLATQWHVDDINGRIKKEQEENENFPQFKILSFPAKASDYKGKGNYPNKYLFMERYDETWYKNQYAVLGPYSSAALFDCDPKIRTGGRFNLEFIDYYETKLGPTDKKWIRVWDLAHTAAARAGDDPDYTSGTKLSIEIVPGDPVPHLWVDDVFRARDGAAERDKKIKAIAIVDSVYIRQGVEVSQDSKDAFEYIKKALPDILWKAISIAGKGDKGARATPLEPIFNCPFHVHVRRADWNNDWISELMSFDGLGKCHDDQVDNLSAGYIYFMNGTAMSEERRKEMAKRRG